MEEGSHLAISSERALTSLQLCRCLRRRMQMRQNVANLKSLCEPTQTSWQYSGRSASGRDEMHALECKSDRPARAWRERGSLSVGHVSKLLACIFASMMPSIHKCISCASFARRMIARPELMPVCVRGARARACVRRYVHEFRREFKTQRPSPR